METFFQDLRYGFRTLRARPAFTAVAIVAPALGVGANTAIFSVVDAVLFKPLPVKEPDRLVAVWATNLAKSSDRDSVSAADYLDWASRNQVFEQMSAHAGAGANLTGLDQPERLRGDFLNYLCSTGACFAGGMLSAGPTCIEGRSDGGPALRVAPLKEGI